LRDSTSIGTLNDILATRVKMQFRHRVDFSKFGYEDFHKARQWCEENCCGVWHVESVHALYFQFDDDRDATMFMLKWSGCGEIK
jgi:hypothetical protein